MIKQGAPIAILFVCTTAISCMASDFPIFDGVYRDSTRTEMVSIQGEEIEFKIRVSKGRDEQPQIVNRKYKFHLLSDGKIRVVASSNDPVFVFGIMKYDWFWDGKMIVRKKPDGSDETTFGR